MENSAEIYLVSGFVNGKHEQELVEAWSARQACKRFCSLRNIGEHEDVPFLIATNILDPDDYCEVENNGFLR